MLHKYVRCYLTAIFILSFVYKQNWRLVPKNRFFGLNPLSNCLQGFQPFPKQLESTENSVFQLLKLSLTAESFIIENLNLISSLSNRKWNHMMVFLEPEKYRTLPNGWLLGLKKKKHPIDFADNQAPFIAHTFKDSCGSALWLWLVGRGKIIIQTQCFLGIVVFRVYRGCLLRNYNSEEALWQERRPRTQPPR